MARSTAALILTFSLASAGAAACGSSAADDEAAGSAATARTPLARTGPADDAGAMADLQASERWLDPQCRFAKTGGWIIASRDDETLYRAAYRHGYIDLTENDQRYHHGRMAPVFGVTLRERGKTASESCGETSHSDSWGMPVSTRKFGSGKFLKQEPGGRAVYEVDFTWVPTSIGYDVRLDLAGPLAVKEGAYRAKVFMKKLRVGAVGGANGWLVDAIDDRSAQKLQ